MIKSALLASVLVAVPAYADDGSRPHLGLTRGDFFHNVQTAYPGLQVPAMRCGEPLVLKHCSARLRSGASLYADETFANDNHLDRFTLGAEGVLFSARIVASDPIRVENWSEFFLYCTALAWIGGAAASEKAAAELVTTAIAKALANVDSGYGASINREKPARFAVETYPGNSTACTVAAQWYDESGDTAGRQRLVAEPQTP